MALSQVSESRLPLYDDFPSASRKSAHCFRRDSPVEGSALQCDASSPPNPSRPSPTRDFTGEALAHSQGLEDRVRMSPRKMRRERRLPPGGLTIDGAADISARISRPDCGVVNMITMDEVM